jgi:HlyD family secretion protein
MRDQAACGRPWSPHLSHKGYGVGKNLSGNVPRAANATHPLRKVVLGLGVVALLAVAGGGYYWWKISHAKPQYVMGDVTQGDIERSVNVTGSINPRVTVTVGSYVSGTVKSLSCDFNSQVKAGQVCAKIDPSTFQVVVDQNAAQLNSSRAQLRKDEAALIYAKAVFERDRKLLTDGIVAQEIVDNDKSVYNQAQAQIDLDKATIVAQQASLKSAVVNLGYTNIVSPVTGTVLTRNVDVGQTVASSLQTPTLFLIGKDMTKMQVDANVSEADVGRIQVDQHVTFSVQAYPDKEFEGSVRQIRRGPITVQNVVTYDVVIAVDNPELLLFPGMTADAEIVTDARANVLRVPLAATRFTPEHAGHGAGGFGRNEGENRAEDRAASQDESSSTDKQVGQKSEASSRTEASAGAEASAKTESSAKAAVPGAQGDDSREARWQHRGAGQGGEHRDWSRGGNHGGHRGEHNGGRRGGRRGEHADRQSTEAQDQKRDDKADGDNQVQQPAQLEQPAARPKAQPRKHARVWVLRDGVPHPISITIGLDDSELVEVLGGDLKPGDKVIVGEAHPVEAKSAPTPSPFNAAGQGGRMRMGRP